jgi:hypothetical protein
MIEYGFRFFTIVFAISGFTINKIWLDINENIQELSDWATIVLDKLNQAKFVLFAADAECHFVWNWVRFSTTLFMAFNHYSLKA